jgi:hypothetical protein
LAKASASARSDTSSRLPAHGKIATDEIPGRKIIPTATLDAKDRTGTCHSLQRLCTKALVRRHRQDQTPAVGEAIEPAFSRPRAAGIDVNDIGLIERNQRAVALDDFDIWVCREIGLGPRGEFGLIFYSSNPA